MLVPTIFGHDAFHGFVEKRNSKRRVSMIWAPNYPFIDERASGGAQYSEIRRVTRTA
jgi:hypothetical protein